MTALNPKLTHVNTHHYYRYARTTVNIRASPSTKSKVIGKIYWNDPVKILKRVNRKWYLIHYKGEERYVCVQYLKKKKSCYKEFIPPSHSTFKSYEDAGCITDSKSIPQGRLKRKYCLDRESGVYRIGNRYCIAVGSYYTKRVGVKIDLVLSHNGRKHTLKCITADSKADKDTINNHRVHKDGSIVEFVVSKTALPSKARRMGDVSYAMNKFKGEILKMKIYQ
jgi:hypothetical protein